MLCGKLKREASMIKRFCLHRHQLQRSFVSATERSIGTTIFNSHNHLEQVRFHSGSSQKSSTTLLPKQYLDAYDPKRFDPVTHQRNDVLFNPIDGTPPSADSHSATPDQKDTHDTSAYNFEESWLGTHLDQWRADPSDFDLHWPSCTNEEELQDSTTTTTKRVLWSNWTADLVRDKDKSPILFEYDDIVQDKDKRMEKRLLKAFYQYGLVLITGTPTATDSLPEEVMTEATKNATNSQERAEDAILHLASMIGYHPLQTLYGSGVWSTSSYSSFYNSDDSDGEAKAGSTADSAYGSTSLPLHTDMTYISNPPGVQIFLMVQPATATTTSTLSSDQDSKTITPSGQSVYLDGFAAAEQLRKENPDAFHLLASTQRRYRCVDDAEGWHLEACGPLINAIQREDGWGPITSIRHNDLDRLPDLPPLSSETNDSNFTAFYEKLLSAHEAWDNILRREEMRLVIDLKCGDCVLVANQRCMHGRYAFDASSFPRVVMGCYVGMDELGSKWRRSGFPLP